ncbi:MAG: saccharopine dehydrogenase NADP-binding domain-containing protein [Candidatus Thorarchaeota archaeon]|nr:saccharopine dehydrogenase NADP-binding domain-containing protein [Candidatus Thorarchaeota archaeon]
MKALVLGSGQMGKGVAFDLVSHDICTEVLVGDIDKERATEVADFAGSKVSPLKIDAENREELKEAFSEADVVVSCVSYRVNPLHTDIAIETATNMVDLGGNFQIVEQQLDMNDPAKKADIIVIPDCGLAPGMTNILASSGIDYLDRTEEVVIRVGGLPKNPRPPLNYSLVFSVEGLINEYVEPCRVLKEGKIAFDDPLIGFEQIEFPNPFGTLEAFNTSGGTSTLPSTYEGKVKNLNYKTIRYPGHGHKMWTLLKLGLMNSEEITVAGTKVAPRRVLEKLLEENLPEVKEDVTLLRVDVSGWKGTESRKLEYELIDHYDEKTGLTSMARTTAFTASAVATMICNGNIEERGVLPPELAVPAEDFIAEMRKRGIDIKKRVF